MRKNNFMPMGNMGSYLPYFFVIVVIILNPYTIVYLQRTYFVRETKNIILKTLFVT